MSCEGGTKYHEAVCIADPDECGHWCCKVRYWQRDGGLRLSTDATPTRVIDRPQPHRPMQQPVWEQGIATVKRGQYDLPILRPGTNVPMRVKEYAERRHEIDAGLRRNHSAP